MNAQRTASAILRSCISHLSEAEASSVSRDAGISYEELSAFVRDDRIVLSTPATQRLAFRLFHGARTFSCTLDQLRDSQRRNLPTDRRARGSR
jgi:hypothetical protein